MKVTDSIFNKKSILEAKSIVLERNQICQNQFYTSIINFGHSRSGTKHS